MPRVGLSPEAVVDLALAVVDEGGPGGFAALSLAAVAARAGVAVPSLYKHVDGLPALRTAVAERCVDELTEAMRAAVAGTAGLVGVDWTSGGDGSSSGGSGSTSGEARPGEARRGEARPGEARPGDPRPGEARRGEARPGDPRPTADDAETALLAIADATRAYALAHPGRYRAVQGAEATTLGERAAAPAELIARVVALLGASPDRWVDQVRAVRAAVHGFVELELAGGFGLPQDVDASFRYLVGTLVTGLTAPTARPRRALS